MIIFSWTFYRQTFCPLKNCRNRNCTGLHFFISTCIVSSWYWAHFSVTEGKVADTYFIIFIVFSIWIYNQFIIFFFTWGPAVFSLESLHRFSPVFFTTEEWQKKSMISSIKRPFVSYLDRKPEFWGTKIMIIAMQTSFPANQRFGFASITYYKLWISRILTLKQKERHHIEAKTQ